MPSGTQIIQAGVSPIIVISACGLLCLAFYNRMAAVVGRLRAFHREQLQVTEALAKCTSSGEEIGLVRNQEILGMLSVQIGHVTRRARLIRSTLVMLLLSVAVMACCSVAVGLATLMPWLAYVAAPLFVIGLGLVVAGVCFAVTELKCAMDPVELESRFVQMVREDLAEVEEAEEPARPPHQKEEAYRPVPLTTSSNRKPGRCGKGPCKGTCGHSHGHEHEHDHAHSHAH
jgi:hypothetical protein